MRTDPTPEPGDLDQSPFSNGTEGEIWTANVCGHGDGCIHDSTYGQSDEELGAEVNCPLITLSFFGVWPHEWERRRVPFTTVEGVESYYETPGDCSEFTDELPTPKPDPVVFGRPVRYLRRGTGGDPVIALCDTFARVLPRPTSERATVTAWAAHLACDADLRTKAPVYADLAGRLTIREVTL